MSAVLIDDMLMKYPLVPNPDGDWTRDMPWKVKGPHYVTTYSRTTKSDGKRQTSQVKIRCSHFANKFADVDLAGYLNYADICDRDETKHRPAWRRRRR